MVWASQMSPCLQKERAGHPGMARPSRAFSARLPEVRETQALSPGRAAAQAWDSEAQPGPRTGAENPRGPPRLSRGQRVSGWWVHPPCALRWWQAALQPRAWSHAAGGATPSGARPCVRPHGLPQGSHSLPAIDSCAPRSGGADLSSEMGLGSDPVTCPRACATSWGPSKPPPPPPSEEQGGLRSEGQHAGSLPASSVSGAGFVGPRDVHCRPG